MTTKLSVAAKTDVGRKRETNEDAFLVADLEKGTFDERDGVTRFEVGRRGALLAVSDGMGGHRAGEVASAMTLESLYQALARTTPEGVVGEPDVRMEGAVQEANKTVATAGQRPSFANMGATLTAVLVEGGEAYIAEVGDSRAYLLREGVLHQLTEDQSFTQAMVNAGGMRPEEAQASSWHNVILQAIGYTGALKVALSKLSLRNRDLLVLCSDGLTNELSDADLCAEILATSTLDAARDRLVALANERGGADNITVLLAGAGGDVPAAKPGERFADTYSTLVSFVPPRVARGVS